MNVVVSLPDSVAKQFGSNEQDLEREVLESLALEGYRSERLTAFQVGEMLGLAMPNEVDGFLKKHGFFLEYTKEEITEQKRILDEFFPTIKNDRYCRHVADQLFSVNK